MVLFPKSRSMVAAWRRVANMDLVMSLRMLEIPMDISLSCEESQVQHAVEAPAKFPHFC
jgi:hypothetical protein